MGASRAAVRSRARQWSHAAWALAVLFGSLPVSSRLFLGVWGFDAAAGMAGLCLLCGMYLHFVSWRRSPSIPDPAAMMDEALQLARSGHTDDAIAALTEAISLSPRLWQAFQYRGELYLLRPESLQRAVDDFDEAIRLMPEEPHLQQLRGYAQRLLDESE